MCLTGVDYFSTLGYAPAIAFLAAQFLSPLATIVLVALTLLGALPVYRRVAQESFRGSGSIAMLERLLPWWAGKLFVLVLLGFAATDFMITITLSAADAAQHFTQNPLMPAWLHGQNLLLTILLIAVLGLVFLKGFREAIGIAVALVSVYLVLNLVIVLVSGADILQHPALVTGAHGLLANITHQKTLFGQHGNILFAVGFALIVFPKLALGMSGFETGVAVMPHIKGDPTDTDDHPAGRIRGARRLLTTAATIMSFFLIATSLITTILITPAQFAGAANGRALAFLAHGLLGPWFGSFYDFSTIAILWFAGASALAGLLNLVPRYLPRYGMAPLWAGAVRPLVIVFTLIAFLITFIFQANVDKQAGAYATGVLVLMTSAAVAVTLAAARKRQIVQAIAFGVIAVVFIYTTVLNIGERPDGVKIAGLFIAAIILVSILSRVRRSFQLRAASIILDQNALDFVSKDAEERGAVRIVSHEPDKDTAEEYRNKSRDERHYSHIPNKAPIIFLEVYKSDSSDFEEELEVRGVMKFGYRVLQVKSGNVPGTAAAVLLAIRDATSVVPDIYFEWTEGNPINNMLRFLITGRGEIAPVTREVLRESEPNPKRRPAVHVS
ncbi:MAG TPA: amino acid transporter [Galbitalea sp.]